jgi:hypothetical protein
LASGITTNTSPDRPELSGSHPSVVESVLQADNANADTNVTNKFLSLNILLYFDNASTT